MIDTNLKGTFLCAQRFARLCIGAGRRRRDRQSRLDRGLLLPCRRRALQRVQGRRRGTDAQHGAGMGPARHPRERGRARADRGGGHRVAPEYKQSFLR